MQRYDTLSEFMHDLRQPNQAFPSRARPPLIERYPVLFWKAVLTVLALIILALLFARRKHQRAGVTHRRTHRPVD